MKTFSPAFFTFQNGLSFPLGRVSMLISSHENQVCKSLYSGPPYDPSLPLYNVRMRYKREKNETVKKLEREREEENSV